MIEKLKTLNRDQLIQKWKRVFKEYPPAGSRKEFLIKHLAWEIQARKYGGLSAETKNRLDKLAKKLGQVKDIEKFDIEKNCKAPTIVEIKVGTKLIREYKGERHEVTAIERGFEYRNKKYKSLSAIANEITGTRWNGKVFFGVKR